MAEVFTLIDVFTIIQREKYRFFWKTALTALSILPTTVSCEQSFSSLKHEMHQNMAEKTGFDFYQASQVETDCPIFSRRVDKKGSEGKEQKRMILQDVIEKFVK